MKFSQLFTKTLRAVSGEETAINAQLLARGGFVYKNSAGVYSYLPLGWRVIGNINEIIREEMKAIGGVELFMPALVDIKYLEKTGRSNLPVGFDVFEKNEKRPAFSLGWTHEEVLTAIASKYISSYKDLPMYLYQIQTKFRNEARAKSGLLRGIEFLMKDLYSFHTSEEDLFKYYEKVKEAYLNIFKRCGLEALYTLAGGGDFTMSNTHEFQVLADVGEDTIFYCSKCGYAENEEISKFKNSGKCFECGGKITKASTIEVGNIFPLGTKYSEALGLNFQDEKGRKTPVVMGSYGIGISRLMASIVEIHNDKNGIIWPREVSPFAVHLIYLSSSYKKAKPRIDQSDWSGTGVKGEADKLYELLQEKNIGVLYDDREDISAGEKFADADLLGIPLRIVVSKKTFDKGIEVKERDKEDVRVVAISELLKSYVK